jgi:hypothetical protein
MCFEGMSAFQKRDYSFWNVASAVCMNCSCEATPKHQKQYIVNCSSMVTSDGARRSAIRDMRHRKSAVGGTRHRNSAVFWGRGKALMSSDGATGVLSER